LLGLASLVGLLVVYTWVSNRLSQPEIIPPTQAIAEAFFDLIAGPRKQPAADPPVDMAHHAHSSDHVEVLLQQGVTLQASLAITTARVLFGLVVGAPIGILLGLFMGLSRRVDDYAHPLYALVRSIPPLALITYITASRTG
jgi:ABC-type nitrate/sulfonate/bicarbonate transport system permease component